MTVVTTSELQSSLPALLERVVGGEEINIEQQGELVAKLVRIEHRLPDMKTINDAVLGLREFCVKHSTGGVTLRAMIDEGRP